MLGRAAAAVLIVASFIAIFAWPGTDSSHDTDYELYLDKVERGELPDSIEHARLSYPLVMMAP